MSIRRRKSQLEKTNPMSTKKRLDERIKQHVKKFRVQLPSNNDINNNNAATAVTRELTPTPPPGEQQDYIGFVSDLFPDNAFVDQSPISPISALTGTSQIVPGSYVPNIYTQDFINSLSPTSYTSASQVVPNDNAPLGMLFGDITQMEMANQQQQQQQQHHHHQQQQRRHFHPPQHYGSAPELYACMLEPLYITPPPVTPVIQLNNQPEPITTAAPQTVTQMQKSHRTPSRPNPPTFENGPTNVCASADLLEHFYTFDTDGSGAISFDELQACLTNRKASKSRQFNSEVITILIEMFDNNNDGMIDRLEFPELIAYLRNWSRCFDFLDEDRSGTLEYQEMHHAISQMGLTVSHSLMKDIMEKYEHTEKNKIDLDNFILCCVTLYRHKETYEFMKEAGGATYSHIGLEEFLRMMLQSSGTKQFFNTLPIA